VFSRYDIIKPFEKENKIYPENIDLEKKFQLLSFYLIGLKSVFNSPCILFRSFSRKNEK